MFATYNYFSQYNDNKPIDDFKSFYRDFSNTREFGGTFTHFDHLVKNRFINNLQHVYHAALRQKPAAILDVGCGAGVNLPLSKLVPSEYHGIDYAEQAIEHARSLYPNVVFHVGDAFAMPFDSGRFDMVILSSVLILYENARDREALLSECLRVLKPNGVLVLTVWNAAPALYASFRISRWLAKKRGVILPNDFNGLHFSKREIRSLVRRVGARVEESFLTSSEYGVLESVRYLNFQKYKRKFGAAESENKPQSQSVLKDIQNQLTHMRWLASPLYYVSLIFPSLFSFFCVNIIKKSNS